MKIRQIRSEKIEIRVRPDLKRRAQEAAERRGVTLSRWIELMITVRLQRERKRVKALLLTDRLNEAKRNGPAK